MKDLHEKGAGSAESSAAERNGANSDRKLTIRKRWEKIRYGPVGRILGYVGAFIWVLAVVTWILWAIERYSR